MATYERETRVQAPLDDVWAFHAGVSGLEALTPRWLNLRVESVTGPDGAPDPAALESGATVSLSIRPFGIGPRTGWTSRILERERRDSAARFVDEMVDGPFDRWVHTHSFVADGDATVVHDRVEYALPLGPAGRVLGPLAWIGFEPMFRHRHRETRRLLEGTTVEVREPERS